LNITIFITIRAFFIGRTGAVREDNLSRKKTKIKGFIEKKPEKILALKQINDLLLNNHVKVVTSYLKLFIK
jgi:hypothetical protein